jgi:hypothetical protein
MDETVFARMRRLVNEEHRLFERGQISDEDHRRLAALQYIG